MYGGLRALKILTKILGLITVYHLYTPHIFSLLSWALVEGVAQSGVGGEVFFEGAELEVGWMLVLLLWILFRRLGFALWKL